MSTPNQVVVSQISDVTTVEITTAGPQGPSFASSGTTLNDSARVDGSVVHFDQASGTFIADTTTKLSLVNGGNF
tara:strand:+ start:381 stop:602 length:222 start_codon:yes stop_codon:yes gene_type:complete